MSALRAKQENIEQGLKPPTIGAVHALEPKRKSAAVRPFKPKHVAKTKSRKVVPTKNLVSQHVGEGQSKRRHVFHFRRIPSVETLRQRRGPG